MSEKIEWALVCTLTLILPRSERLSSPLHSIILCTKLLLSTTGYKTDY